MSLINTFSGVIDNKTVCLQGIILKETEKNYHVKLDTGECGNLPKDKTKITKNESGYYNLILPKWVAVRYLKQQKLFKPYRERISYEA